MVEKQDGEAADSVLTLNQIALASAREKPYRIWLLFTHKSGDVKAISVTERRLAIIGAGHMRLPELILTPNFVKSVLNGFKAPTSLAN